MEIHRHVTVKIYFCCGRTFKLPWKYKFSRTRRTKRMVIHVMQLCETRKIKFFKKAKNVKIKY